MWGKIIIPMYRLWLNGLYGLYGPRCPLFSKRPINLISLSLYSLIHSQMHVSLHYGKITLKPDAWWYLVKGIKTKRLLCFLSLVAALHDYDIYIGKTEVTQNFQSSGHQVSVHLCMAHRSVARLIHQVQNKWPPFFQTTFSNSFSSINMIVLL